MTVKELSDSLQRLMNEYPNTINDEISFYDDSTIKVYPLDEVAIEYDINTIGRNIVVK